MTNYLNCATQFLGTMNVYHATSRIAAVSIYQNKDMRPGSGGMLGAGIYFADTPQSAQNKSRFGKNKFAIIIYASVNFGTALVLDAPCRGMNSVMLTKRGTQSVKGRQGPNHPWEFVAYRSDQVLTMLFCDCSGDECLELTKRLAKELPMMHLKTPMVVQIWLNVAQTIAPITKFFSMEEQTMQIKSGLDGHG
jgi:hypothetical protein